MTNDMRASDRVMSSVSAPRVLVIIPAYNEEANIAAVAKRVRDAGYDYLVVNDGSVDRTEGVCQEHHLNYVSLPVNMGIGGAVQTGHLYAYENGYDVDIQVDGDGQHDISYAPRLIEQIENGADLVIGSRFVSQSEGFQSTVLRRAGIKWLEKCIRHVTGLTITDSTSGFRASGKAAIALFAQSYPADYPEPESIVSAYRHGLDVVEVPVSMHERQGGKSSINAMKSIYYMIKVSLAIFIVGKSERKGR